MVNIQWYQILLKVSFLVATDRQYCRRGAIHVLWTLSKTKIAIILCDRSNERAYFSACVDGIFMKVDLKKRLF